MSEFVTKAELKKALKEYVKNQDFKDHRRDKIGKHHSSIKTDIKENEQRVVLLEGDMNNVDEKLEIHDARLTALEEGGSNGNGGGEYPALVYNLDTLIQFVKVELGDDAHKVYPEKKIPAARVRDALAQRYPEIARLNDDPIGNGYTASEHKHRDAFWNYPQNTIIDFVKGSSASGSLLNKDGSSNSLQWARQPITPW